MEKKMFCYQCEQTAGGSGCTGAAGVCGKSAGVSKLQDELIAMLIMLAKVTEFTEETEEATGIIIDGLFTTITNVDFNEESLKQKLAAARAVKDRLLASRCSCQGKCLCIPEYSMESVFGDRLDEDVKSLKSLILFGLKGMAAYAHHAAVLGYQTAEINSFFYNVLRLLIEDCSQEELLAISMKLGEVNLKCMELLDKANTETYGSPVPVMVPLAVEKGPFIIITGHDLHDLQLLLEQTRDRGINIYTHSEMLPAHAYPKLKQYSHLKGNFGTAWQNQQKEFDGVPAPILFTTNCLMPVKSGYNDRVFTSGAVSYPSMAHIGSDKDFTPVINKALELGGYSQTREMTGINGGTAVTTGFARDTVLSVADTVVNAVKTGAIRHFFLVGGCDGGRPGRNYYTEFVKQAPKDTVILTLACGKYRFNDLDLGTIGGLPRLMDMGQCNDAYSAIRVAVALAEAFDCGVNELPLTLMLSWYEQKAVCILLSLLSLGIKNIYLGPTLPAFISPNLLSLLVKEFNLKPISTPESDLAEILG